MKGKSKGGIRQGAGRKPTADPKQPVTIFVETSKINAYGGKEGVQLFCYNALDADKWVALSPPKDVYDSPPLDMSKIKDEPDFNKKFPPSDREIKQKAPKEEKRPIIKDFTKPTNVLKPQEQPETDFSINTALKTLDELKSRCPAELKGIDRSMWISTERQKYGI